jgi:tetratricopeptide (TPR) repeat protein
MVLRLVLIGGGLALLGLLPHLFDVVADSLSRRAIAHCLAGEELLIAGWLIPAEREFRRALRLQPLLGAACCGLGKVRVQQERYDEAVVEFRRAISALDRVDQKMGRARADGGQAVPITLIMSLADALERAGKPAEAQRLRALPPSDPEAATLLASNR